MITIKLKIKNKSKQYDDILRQYNNVYRYAYNRFIQNKQFKRIQVQKLVTKNMNNIGLLDASLIRQSVTKAEQLFLSRKQLENFKVIFGGKNNFKKYNKRLITKQQLLNKRLTSIRVIGSISDKGNRKFKLNLNNNKVIFKPCRSNHIQLQYFQTSKQNKKLLSKLQKSVDNKQNCFTCSIDKEYIYLVFDQLKLKNEYKYKKDRIASIDLNPNYIALIIRDNNKILVKNIYSLKQLNDLDKRNSYKDKQNKIQYRKYLHNKRKYQSIKICQRITNLCKQYKVQNFIMEDLNIKSSNKNKGKKFNKRCNNDWLRNLISNNIIKRCNLIGIKVNKVFAGYSSIKGQLENENDFDSIAASIQLSKRLNKNMKDFGNTKVKLEDLSNRWKNEIISNFNQVPTWKNISEYLKRKYFNSSYRYFFNHSNFQDVSLSLFHKNSKIKLYQFKT